jgi:hypothetical protein
MEAIMTVLTVEQQSLVRPIVWTCMPTTGTCLATEVGIDLDGHTLMERGFVGDHAVQLGKVPLGVGSIGFPLLLGRLLATSSFSPFTDMGQVFQSDQAVGGLLHDALGDDMIGVLLQPSLSSTDRLESARCRTSAFVLKIYYIFIILSRRNF